MSVAAHIMTGRLHLRQPQAGDLPAYTAYCASPRSHFVRGPFTAPQAFEKFAAIIGHWTLRGYGRYIITLDGAPIGHVGPSAVDGPELPEMTWSLWSGAVEGQGYATEAAQAVCQHLLGDQGWREMIIHVLPENRGSVRIAEQIGARKSDDPAPDWYPGSVCYRLSAEALQ